MIEIIAKYWLNFVLTILSGGLVFLCKKFWSMYKAERSNNIDETHKQMLEEMEETVTKAVDVIHQENVEQQKEIIAIKRGLLDVQGEAFKNFCHILLQPDHVITIEEYEEATVKHDAYNGLGGNHDGDNLYSMVVEKAKNQLAQA